MVARIWRASPAGVRQVASGTDLAKSRSGLVGGPGALASGLGVPIFPIQRRGGAIMPEGYRISAGGTEESVARVEALARLMDGVFTLPGTNLRLGLDAIVGLVPVAGDVISGLISSYLIWE